MGQKYCKKINLEVTPQFHEEIKKQALIRNITMRKLILRYLEPAIYKNKILYEEKEDKETFN